MANEPIYDVASPDFKNKLCSAQTAVESRLLPMGGVLISKVLSYSANCFVAVSDVFTGEARVAGKVSFKVLFLDEGGGTRTMETNVDFTDKIVADGIAGKPEITARILDTDIISVSSDEIKLAAIVEMDLYDNVSNRIKFLRFGGDDIYTREEKVSFTKLAAKTTELFSLTDEIRVKGNRILLADAAVVVLGVNAGADNVSITGEIISNIITEADLDLNSYRLVTPFSYEAEAEGCRSDCTALMSVRLKSVNAAFDTISAPEDNGESNIDNLILLQFDAEVSGFCYQEESINAVSDAFSIHNELSLSSTEITLSRNRSQKTMTEKIEGSITLEADMPIADKILAVSASKLSITNSYILDGRMVIEGMVNAAVIYYSAETGTKNSVDIELPFSSDSAEDEDGECLSAFGEVYEITARLRRGNEIDIRAEIAVVVHTVKSEKVRLLSELSLGEAVNIPSAAVSLYIARSGEALWDVAKALKTTPELILLQNPELLLPLRGGERIIIYRHLKN